MISSEVLSAGILNQKQNSVTGDENTGVVSRKERLPPQKH
jgi:hypothetical protein